MTACLSKRSARHPGRNVSPGKTALRRNTSPSLILCAENAGALPHSTCAHHSRRRRVAGLSSVDLALWDWAVEAWEGSRPVPPGPALPSVRSASGFQPHGGVPDTNFQVFTCEEEACCSAWSTVSALLRYSGHSTLDTGLRPHPTERKRSVSF